MVHVVSGAFFTTRVADLRAKLANAFGKFGVGRHLSLRQSAYGRATAIQPNAPLHIADILFTQTGGGAVFARHSAVVTGFNTGFVTIVSHGGLP